MATCAENIVPTKNAEEPVRTSGTQCPWKSFLHFHIFFWLCYFATDSPRQRRLPVENGSSHGSWKIWTYDKKVALTCQSYERKAVLTCKKKHPPGQLFHPEGTSLDENSQDPPSVGRSDASRKGSPEHKLLVLTQKIEQYKYSLSPFLYQLINLGWFIKQSPGPSCLSAVHVFRPADKDLVESPKKIGYLEEDTNFNLDWSSGLARRCDRKNWRQASCLQKNLWGTGCVFTEGW